MNLVLVRDYAAVDCTLGTLTIVEVPQLVLQTLELPWWPEPGSPCGRPDRSCLPVGTYQLLQHDSPAHPHTFALTNPGLGVFHNVDDVPVPQPYPLVRTDCLIHAANWVSQLEGCIAVGISRQMPGNGSIAAVWQSRAALGQLMTALPWAAGNTLTISYAAGVTPP